MEQSGAEQKLMPTDVGCGSVFGIAVVYVVLRMHPCCCSPDDLLQPSARTLPLLLDGQFCASACLQQEQCPLKGPGLKAHPQNDVGS